MKTTSRFYSNGVPAKVGDSVICVDDTSSFNRLVRGGMYVVGEAFDGTPVVFVGNAPHCTDRFVIAAAGVNS